MKMGSEENWDILIHDCSNHTKFSRELNKNSKLKNSFGFNTYRSEFDRDLFHIFLPILKDENFNFISEKSLPLEFELEKCKSNLIELAEYENSKDEFYENF